MTDTYTCPCGTTKDVERGKRARLPRGWKRVGEQTLCPACKSKAYVLRAVTFPVVGPVGIDWPSLRVMLRDSWSETTACANFLMTELYSRDCRRNGQEKLPKWEVPYLYPATARFRLPSTSRAALEQAIKGKYRAKRYDLLWTCECSLPNFRYPVPYAVPNQAWRARFGTEEERLANVPLVALPFVGNEGRITLRLRGGAEYRRQLAAFRKIVSGEAIQGELAIYRVRASEPDGRNGDRSNEAARPVWRVLAKLVAWFPRAAPTARTAERFFNLRTDKDCFLYGVLQDREEPWIVNADHVREWCFQHRRWLQRMSEDAKHERRKPKRRRARTLVEYDSRGGKHKHRMDSFVRETAAHTVAFAARNNVTRICYDATESGYLPSFPWFAFRGRLEQVCMETGIEFVASGGLGAKTPDMLASSVNEETT